MRSQLFAALIFIGLAGAQGLPTVSVLPHAVELRRIPAEGRWDLVVALSSSQPCEKAPRPCWWNTKDRLAILLQDRDDPTKVMPLAIEPGPNDDCSTRIERFTTEELVMSCVGQKWSTYDNQKFFFDVRGHRLENHVWYAPYSSQFLLPGPKFVMCSSAQRLVVEIDPVTGDPRVSSGKAPPPPQEMELTLGQFHLTGQENPTIVGEGKVYALNATEQIGPHQIEGGLLWFGKTFYNGEGMTGTGGFGYFDTTTASYRLFAPSEMAEWSVSAILVEPEAVWLALYHRGEYGNYPGGILRWDRNAQTARRWDMPWVATVIARSGDAIWMGTTDGIAVVRGDQVSGYFVDRSTDGKYHVAAR